MPDVHDFDIPDTQGTEQTHEVFTRYIQDISFRTAYTFHIPCIYHVYTMYILYIYHVYTNSPSHTSLYHVYIMVISLNPLLSRSTDVALRDSSSDICLYSSRGIEQLLMSTVVQIDFLSCCGSRCIKYRISLPFLDF